MNARWSPKTKAADTAKARFITLPFLFILSALSIVAIEFARVAIRPTTDVSSRSSFLPNAERGFLRSFEIIAIRGNVPARVIQIVKTVAALSVNGAVFLIITLPVRVWKIPRARPQVMRIEMNFPNIEKILIVISGNFRRPIMIMTEMRIAGARLIKTVRGLIPIARPETKQPTGMVLIPQRSPRRTSLWCSFFDELRATGIVNEMVAPSIDATQSPWKEPKSVSFATESAKAAPPISLAIRIPAKALGSKPKKFATGVITGSNKSARAGAIVIIPNIERESGPKVIIPFSNSSPSLSRLPKILSSAPITANTAIIVARISAKNITSKFHSYQQIANSN